MEKWILILVLVFDYVQYVAFYIMYLIQLVWPFVYRHQKQSRIEDETDYFVSVKKNSSEHDLKIAIIFCRMSPAITLDLTIPFGGGVFLNPVYI